ncbi:MAG: eCIS core domain-containing protein [Flavobacteriales bacterium]
MQTHTQQAATSEKTAAAQRSLQEPGSGEKSTVSAGAKLPFGSVAASPPPVQRKENRTGMPDSLKAGIEKLSGYSMDDVKVHYNSAAPAQLQAHAYAQGSDIHIAPGQEKHLPHEAWHVVQQKQGRVQPTAQLKGKVAVNDDSGLEKEADIMGARAAQLKSTEEEPVQKMSFASVQGKAPVQRKIELYDRDTGAYRETEDGKPASGAGDLYFTGRYYKTLPVFVNASKVNEVLKFVEEMQGINEDTDDDKYYKELNKGINSLHGGIEVALPGAVFYTDDEDVTDSLDNKGFWLRQALSKPLMRDPLAKRGGFMNRFQSASGMLFSPKTKEEVEEDLGELPDGVGFQRTANSEAAFEYFGKGHKAIISGDYMYIRGVFAPGPGQDEGSVFSANGAQGMGPDDDRLKDDSLTAVLPAATGDTVEDVVHKAYARKKSRGAGQIAAMNNWNALGYAGYWKHHGKGTLNVKVDWEWLHIRGAQNGGETSADNLVAGTSVANSAMIPVEDKINEWTAAARADHPMMVRYTGRRIAGTNLGREITLKIWAPNGLPNVTAAIQEGQAIQASFNPLTDSSFDRMHRQMLARQLDKLGTDEAADLKY